MKMIEGECRSGVEKTQERLENQRRRTSHNPSRFVGVILPLLTRLPRRSSFLTLHDRYAKRTRVGRWRGNGRGRMALGKRRDGRETVARLISQGRSELDRTVRH